jgi:hypothetical protein
VLAVIVLSQLMVTIDMIGKFVNTMPQHVRPVDAAQQPPLR